MNAHPLPLLLLIALPCACDDAPLRPDHEPTAAEPVHLTPPSTSRPMMIEFTRDFCLPCQILAPSIAELRQTHAAEIDVVEVNLDREKHERHALFFRIEAVPTLVFVDPSGRILARHDGIATKEEMERTFASLGWIR
jgi:thioredoxin 1